MGAVAEERHVRRLELRAGRFLPDEPWERGARVVVLGGKLANELMPGQNPLGTVVRVGGWRMRVIGVLASQGVRFGIDLDDTLIIPVATAMAMFDKDSLFRIAVQVRPGSDVERVKAACTTVLAGRTGRRTSPSRRRTPCSARWTRSSRC